PRITGKAVKNPARRCRRHPCTGRMIAATLAAPHPHGILMPSSLRRFGPAVLIAVALVVAWQLWQRMADDDGFPGIASGNGRIEATEIDVATKAPGRVAEILVDEGDFVSAGQVLARMDTEALQAQLREARAGLARARIGVETAHSLVAQREAELAAAGAVIAQREA